ncbi:hypothetical protein VTO73DRAFT_2526 [Trametes versicolor]
MMHAKRDARTSPEPESTEEPPSLPAVSPYPFNKPSADVVIRCCDLVEFRVRSHIIIEASPVLEAMLARLSTPSQHLCSQRQTSSSLVLKLAEDGKTVETLLRICYPIVDPDSYSSPGEVESALRAAMKYEMALPIKVLSDYVEYTISPESPLEAWAIACRLGLEHLARDAAQESLRFPLNFTSLGNMEGITAGHYYRLMEYHRREGDVADEYQLLNPILSSEQSEQSEDAPDASSSVPPPSLPDMPNANLICRSSDGVDFRVQKHLFLNASRKIRRSINVAERAHEAALQRATCTSSSSSEEDEPPMMPRVQLSEKAVVLALLFSHYRLGTDFELPSLDLPTLADVMAAARSYGANGLQELAYKCWSPLARASPFHAYLAAATRGAGRRLEQYARDAARIAIDIPQLETVYIAELEEYPALVYHRLFSFRSACRAVAVGQLQEILRHVSVAESDSEEGTVRPETLAQEMATTSHASSTSPTTLVYPKSVSISQLGPGDSKHAATRASLDKYKSKSPWLAAYVASLCEKAEACPGAIARTGTAALRRGSTFAEATRAGTAWCGQCQLLASDMSNLEHTLALLCLKMHAVALEM